MQISIPSPDDGDPVEITLESGTITECLDADWREKLDITESIRNSGVVDKCPVCGCDELYVQSDLSQRIGCITVLIGAVLVPWTYGISLIVVAVIDLLLYTLLKKVTICYQCKSVIRGFTRNPGHGAFDMSIEEKYRLARRLREEDKEEQ